VEKALNGNPAKGAALPLSDSIGSDAIISADQINGPDVVL
jgi:hypothetical protein